MLLSFRSSVRWVKRVKAWKRERGNGRSGAHAALGLVGVYGGWRARELGRWRGVFMVCISVEA